ncbi:MAG: methionine--tRNA ligase [Myxococcales bacterium]|nr:methionine--tRNA ligase [Myxococcales bacterium]
MNRLYITTPIYYVNDRPHLGHAYTTILADVIRRYYDMLGAETWFLTGVDEHGQKVQDAAKKRGMTPIEHCDDMQRHFRDLWPQLQVSNDDFIRTTEPRHWNVVQKALSCLYDKGDIYEREYEGWYSPSVERFWTENELVNGRCPESGAEVVYLNEKNYWFRMSKYQERLLAWIESHPEFIVPESRKNEVLGFLARPLQDLCISRPKERLSWGIEIPFDSNYVTYVWFDALLNYATGVGLYADNARFDQWWPATVHLLGKDILTTHCVYWNTFLMALELPLPKHFVAHGWWLIDETKMSKSLGNVVSPLSLRDKYGIDVLRYFLMKEMTLGLDANFSEEALVNRNNSDLANDLGNLLSRVTKLLKKEPFSSVVPARGDETAEDVETLDMVRSLPTTVGDKVRAWKINAAVEDVMTVVRRLNKYVNDTRPFSLVKENPQRAGAVLYNVLEGLRFVATSLWPVIPRKAEQILVDIGWDAGVPRLSTLNFGDLESGCPVQVTQSLFPRHDWVAGASDFPKEVVHESPLRPSPSPEKNMSTENEITFDDFAKLKMVVGEIMEAETVPKSDKLLRLVIDIGEEKRQIVSGIAKYYDPEMLVGRRVVVLTNLQARKIFGLESRGMVLAAADSSGELALITPERYMDPGAEVS